MKNQTHHCDIKKLYDKATRQWFYVPSEAYEAYDHERTAFRKNMQYQGRCKCPRSKWWLCDMMCMYCEFQSDGTLSLDMPQGIDADMTLMDIIPDNHATMDEQLAEEDLVDRLIERLHQIDPDTESMLNICKEKEKISARAIARALNKPQRTFADQIKRDRMELQKIR